jgi:hypothetical protein
LSKFPYKAATKAATSPATPPKPAIIAFAPPVDDTGGGVVAVLERIVEFDGAVVAGALVVLTVEVVVEAAAVLVLEAVLELDVVAAEVVVVAETLAREAEYAEQRAKPMDSAAITSDAAQAVTRQGAAYPPRTAMVAGLHWQPSSVRAHPADEMAASRHGTWMSTVRIQSTYFSQSIELWEKRGQDGRDSVV